MVSMTHSGEEHHAKSRLKPISNMRDPLIVDNRPGTVQSWAQHCTLSLKETDAHCKVIMQAKGLMCFIHAQSRTRWYTDWLPWRPSLMTTRKP